MEPILRLRELISRGITDLTADERTELTSLITQLAETLAGEQVTSEVVAQLTEVADARDALAADDERLATEQAALDEQRQAALARLTVVPAAEASDDATEEQAVEETAVEDGEDQVDEPEALAASTRTARPVVPAQRTPLQQLRPPATTRPRGNAPAALRAETRVVNAQTGQELADRRAVVEAMARAIDANRTGGSGDQFTVVSATTQYPQERRFQHGADSANEQLLRQTFEPQALVAAGGLCAPVDNRYDVRVVGDTDRPVRDSLPSFGTPRGGINLRPPAVFQDFNGAVGDWTLQNDIDAATAGAPDPTKAILEALCPGFTAYYVDATTMRLRFRNVQSRFDPEGTQANLDATEVAFARVAENKLITKMQAMALEMSAGRVLGASRDVLAHVDKLLAYYRSRRRLRKESTQLHAWLPQWVKDMIRTDILRGAEDPAAFAIADAQIDGFFGARGVNVTWHLDGRLTARASGAGIPAVAAQTYGAFTSGSVVPGYPAQIEMLVAVEGDYLLLDGGELNLGLVRDSALNGVNAYEMFREEFFGIAFQGIEALNFVISTEPTGLRAGYSDTSAIAD